MPRLGHRNLGGLLLAAMLAGCAGVPPTASPTPRATSKAGASPAAGRTIVRGTLQVPAGLLSHNRATLISHSETPMVSAGGMNVVPTGHAYVVATEDGGTARFETLVKPGTLGATADVDAATTLVAAAAPPARARKPTRAGSRRPRHA